MCLARNLEPKIREECLVKSFKNKKACLCGDKSKPYKQWQTCYKAMNMKVTTDTNKTPSPHDITTMIKFPETECDKIDITKYYNRIEEKRRKHVFKYQRKVLMTIKYDLGKKLLI